MTSRRITPSLVISVLALIVALGGASYAALKLPRNSVGTKQLKKNAVTAKKLRSGSVTTRKLKGNAVTSAKVKDGTLKAADLAPDVLPGKTWYAERDTVPLFDVTANFQPVVQTPVLPAGTYLVVARANVLGSAAISSLICSTANDAAQNFTVASNGVLPLSMNGIKVLDEPATIDLNCNKSSGTPQIAQAHVIATRIPEVIGLPEGS